MIQRPFTGFIRLSVQNRIFVCIIVACVSLFASVPAFSQNDTSADTVAVDTIDRMDPDFITASICFADPTDWRDDFLGVLGHAFIRLQCPTFGYDYSFSYESENAKDEMSRFLKGKLRMGMFREQCPEYIKTFEQWHCAIHEYRLNLPPDVEQKLWEIMDIQVGEGEDLQFDLIRRGCTQTLVRFVETALGTTRIEYPEWADEYKYTRRQIINQRLEPYPWIRFLLSDLLVDDDFNSEVTNEEKILYPAQLAEAWQKATVDGKPLLQYKGDLVKAPAPLVENTLITPIAVAVLLLIIAIVSTFTQKQYVDYALLGMQCVVGVLLCWFVFMSNLPGSRGANLLPFYNPLLLLMWHWRKNWRLLYAIMLLAWEGYLIFSPSMYVEPAHLVFGAAMMVILLKPTIRKRLYKCHE